MLYSQKPWWRSADLRVGPGKSDKGLKLPRPNVNPVGSGAIAIFWGTVADPIEANVPMRVRARRL